MTYIKVFGRLGRARILRAAVLPILLLLSACDESSGTSAEAYLERATAYYEKGELQASIIEAKNALLKNPDLGPARLLLGRVYIERGNVASAEKELRRARELGMPGAVVFWPLGQAMLAQSKHREALTEFPVDETVSKGEQAMILAVRGNAYGGLRDTKMAKDAFERALDLDPNNVRALTGRARLAFQEKTFEITEEMLDRARKIDPKDPDVFTLRGDLALARGQHEEAEAAFRELVEAYPGNWGYLLPLAYFEIVRGNLDEAVINLERVLKVVPKHPGANYLRGLASYQAGDHGAAKTYMDKVLAVDSGHSKAKLLAGAANYSLGENEHAYRLLSGYVAKSPENAQARRLLGATMFRLGLYKEAVSTLESLADGSADDVAVLRMIGAAALKTGDLERSRKSFQRVASIEPADAKSRAQLGAIQMALGQTDQGLEEFEKALEQDPNLDQALAAIVIIQLREKQFENALISAQRLREAKPDIAAPVVLVGIAHAGLGQVDLARQAFSEALAIQPGYPDAGRNLARLELRQGNLGKGRDAYQKVLEQDPGDLRTLLELADLENLSKRYEQAARWLEQAREANPDSADPLVALARLHVKTGAPEKAVDLAGPLVARFPENPLVLETVGKAQLILGRHGDALPHLENLARVRPDSAEPRYLVARALIGLKRAVEGRTELENALRIDPGYHPARILLSRRMSAAGETGLARVELEKLRVALPREPRVSDLEASILVQEKRLPEAVVLFARAFQAAPNSQRAVRLAVVQRRSGNSEAAIATLQTWLQSHPAEASPRRALGDIYAALGRYREALGEYGRLIDGTTKDAPLLNNYAFALLKTGDTGGAERHARQALALAPDIPEIKGTLGNILTHQGKTEEALALLREAASARPDNPVTQFYLAHAIAKSGRAGEARAMLRAVLDNNPDFPERSDAKALLDSLN